MTGHLSIEQLESMKKADLQALAKELGVSTKGNIKEIAARCAEVEVEVDTTEEADMAAAEIAAEAPDEAENAEADEAAADGTAEKAETKAKKTADEVEVQANQTFLDKQRSVIVKKGEKFKVTKERAEQLSAAKVVG